MEECPHLRNVPVNNFLEDTKKGEGGKGSCPVPNNNLNMMPMDLDKQKVSGLSMDRVGSSIPRADADDTTWLYPSPTMFFNAMQRKGHNPRVEDMDLIVTIHNIVNEQAWQEILRWEHYYHPKAEPKLSRFLGKPNNLSPKAWLRTFLLGYTRPFDRHDWFIERDGEKVRYVIDFYSGQNNNNSNNNNNNSIKGEGLSIPSFHIDARPALDSFEALYERCNCAMRKALDKAQSYFRK